MKENILILDNKDNVGINIDSTKKIGFGHKIALKSIKKGALIIKFGQIIGVAKKDISVGDHVHIHNISYSAKIFFNSLPKNQNKNEINTLPGYFKGYIRRNGRAGTRNHIIILSTVNCSASVTRAIAEHFKNKKIGKGIDSIIPVIHSSGCAQAIGGRSDVLLNKTLAGWLYHPNVVGAVVIGLGCEDISLKTINKSADNLIKNNETIIEYFNIQEVGGTKKAIELGKNKVQSIISKLPSFKRTILPVKLLTVGLNCGGSDSLSSITANPALGATTDILTDKGGSAVISETPECSGAENIMLSRCKNKKDQKKLSSIFKRWGKDYSNRGICSNNNLAPGNITGGISTILEKSLGAIAKGGSGKFSQVLEYAEQITKNGLIFMDTPGFDPISVTGQVAGGCNVIAFTTGRGSVYGCSIVPTIKIATNSATYRTMQDDIDINSGVILDKNISIDHESRKIYVFLIDVASGKLTASEQQGMGTNEFAPWQLGENL